jgi:hypothetical protein
MCKTMDEQDDIIVFKRFENAIDANIIKTKLDAHGIPCFLTEENLANLYPTLNLLSNGVRLHLFEKDIEWAKEVLKENNLSLNDDSND